MIAGWLPLLTLWVIVAACWVCWGLTLNTPWRDTAVGRALFGFTLIHAVWWSLILFGSYAPAYWTWLQAVQAVAFVLVAVALVWLAVLMGRAHYRSLLPRRAGRRRGSRTETR